VSGTLLPEPEQYGKTVGPVDNLVVTNSGDLYWSLEQSARGESARSPGHVKARVFTTDPLGEFHFLARRGEVVMLPVRGGPAVRRFAPLRGVAKELALSPDGQLLAACASADGVVLFNASTGERVRTLPVASLHPRVAWRYDSAQLATSGGKRVEVWDADSGSRLATLPAFASVVHSLAVTPEGGVLGVNREGDLFLWRDGTLKKIGGFEGDSELVLLSRWVAVSRLASVVWLDRLSLTPIGTTPVRGQRIKRLARSESQEYVAAADSAGSLFRWCVPNG
jgi:WD40 repeat protein